MFIPAPESTNNPLPKILFCVGELHAEASGVTRVVCDLANALVRSGQEVDVYTASFGRRPTSHLLANPERLIAVTGMGRLGWSPRLKRRLDRDVPGVGVVHNHGLWMLPPSYASRAAFAASIPVVYSTHGYLEPWALNRSSWKKRIAGAMFQNRDLHRAAAIHVLSEAELISVRSYGLERPIAVIPNGIDVEQFENLPGADEFSGRYPHLRGKRVCLFLSRLHSIKGLSHLIRAWNNVAPSFPEWHLVLAGPDDGAEAEIRKAIEAMSLGPSVTLTGALYGKIKLAALAAADVFVLPSFSEGFSMAILEALACGVPALITPRCNFSEAVAAGAAIEVTPDVASTEVGLRELMSLTDAQREGMGQTGRELVNAKYTWQQVAQQMVELYRWLTAGGARPSFVD